MDYSLLEIQEKGVHSIFFLCSDVFSRNGDVEETKEVADEVSGKKIWERRQRHTE